MKSIVKRRLNFFAVLSLFMFVFAGTGYSDDDVNCLLDYYVNEFKPEKALLVIIFFVFLKMKSPTRPECLRIFIVRGERGLGIPSPPRRNVSPLQTSLLTSLLAVFLSASYVLYLTD